MMRKIHYLGHRITQRYLPLTNRHIYYAYFNGKLLGVYESLLTAKRIIWGLHTGKEVAL